MITLNRFFYFLVLSLFALNAPLPAFAAEEAPAEGEEGAAKDEYAYFEMKGITIPIVRSNGVPQFSSYLITLEVPKENEKKIEAKVPKLRDAYISYMFRLAQYDIDNKLRNLEFVKDRLREVTDEVVDEELIHDILIRGARDQRF